MKLTVLQYSGKKLLIKPIKAEKVYAACVFYLSTVIFAIDGIDNVFLRQIWSSRIIYDLLSLELSTSI